MAFACYRNHVSKRLLVFLHGLGDSHLNYVNFIDADALSEYDILVPDLLGCGKSESNHIGFNFQQQVQAIIEQIHHLKKNDTEIILIAHSMSGSHAALLAESELTPRIKGIFAIETRLTQYGGFMGGIDRAINVDYSDEWFDNWCQQIYLQGRNEPVMRNYYCGLKLTTRACFSKNHQEICEEAIALSGEKFTSITGYRFAKLKIAKMYCFAEHGSYRQNMAFLQMNTIPFCCISNTASHFCAQLKPQLFLQNLTQWLNSF